MATYQELRSLFNNSDLMEKVEVSVVKAANDLNADSPTAADKAWISHALTNTSAEAKKALKIVLAENSSASVSAIMSASDATVQSNVNSVVPTLVDALAGV